MTGFMLDYSIFKERQSLNTFIASYAKGLYLLLLLGGFNGLRLPPAGFNWLCGCYDSPQPVKADGVVKAWKIAFLYLTLTL